MTEPTEDEIVDLLAAAWLEHTVGPKPKTGYRYYPEWETLPESHKRIWRDGARQHLLPTALATRAEHLAAKSPA